MTHTHQINDLLWASSIYAAALGASAQALGARRARLWWADATLALHVMGAVNAYQSCGSWGGHAHALQPFARIALLYHGCDDYWTIKTHYQKCYWGVCSCFNSNSMIHEMPQWQAKKSNHFRLKYTL